MLNLDIFQRQPVRLCCISKHACKLSVAVVNCGPKLAFFLLTSFFLTFFFLNLPDILFLCLNVIGKISGSNFPGISVSGVSLRISFKKMNF